MRHLGKLGEGGVGGRGRELISIHLFSPDPPPPKKKKKKKHKVSISEFHYCAAHTAAHHFEKDIYEWF